MAASGSLQGIARQLRHVLLQGNRLPVTCGLLITLLVFLFFTSRYGLIADLRQRLDHIVYDLRFNISQEHLYGNRHNIVIVDYDEKSLEAEGQWPWSRFKLARLTERLGSYGAYVVGYDVFFPESERNLLRELQDRIRLSPDYQAQVDELLPVIQDYESVVDGDQSFASAMQTVDTVLGFSLGRDEERQSGTLPAAVFHLSDADRELLFRDRMFGHVANIEQLQNSAAGAGFFDVDPDSDGVIRSIPLFMQYQEMIYPSLALEMYRVAEFIDWFALDVGEYEGNRWLNGLVTSDGLRIPTDEQGRVKVPYIGQQKSFPYISATDVLRGTLTAEQEEQLLGSLVLVGTTAPGLYDLRATPVEKVYPGVEIHANVLNALLNAGQQLEIDGSTPVEPANADTGGKTGALKGIMSVISTGSVNAFPTRPDWEERVVGVFLIGLGVLLSFLFPRLGVSWLALVSMLMLGLVIWFNIRLWRDYNLDFSLISPLLLISLLMVFNMGWGFLQEASTRKTIKGMFDQYVPPAHIDAMLEDPEKYNFAGESREMTVLFSDIRGFTSISEKLSAAELKTLLNDFFTPITGIIFEQQGTIDKYVGDMVMAFWGAPLEDTDHRRHAVLAALQMLEKTEELKADFRTRGLPEVSVGIGINTGMMNVGDMGSSYRRSYTVLGDAVNLGSRLEGITKVYGVKMLIGEETHDGLQGFVCRLVDKVQVKGKEEPVRIYQPLCLQEQADEQLLSLLADYDAAYQAYLDRQWQQSEAAFRALQARDPDTALYQLYLDRIASLREQQLPANWDGTYRHTSK